MNYRRIIIALIERDLKDLWSSNKQLQRDCTEIKLRLRAEGLCFLTKALPSLGKALDRALAKGSQFCLPPGFSRREGEIPKLFGDLFLRVFGPGGELLPAPCIRSVAGLRQLAYMFYKLQLPYTDEQTRRVIRQFVDVDTSLPDDTGDYCPNDSYLDCVRKLLASFAHGEDYTDIIPHHGPGSVATGESNLEKTKFSRIYDTLERHYPFTEYFRFGLTHVCDDLGELQELEQHAHPCAKVVLVPKDSRGPRLISMEPLEVQWIQQGVKDKLYRLIESHPLTRGQVNFTDQTVNQDLARSASFDAGWATMDMQEASDRVSLALVRRLLGDSPLWDALEATRSKETLLPDGSRMVLKKFAPMGSALCFPIEALIFWAMSVVSLRMHSSYSLRFASKLVYVYGDDIVVPIGFHEQIRADLERYSLLFNEDKCCTSPKPGFRESCGVDAFLGEDVTPIRVKRLITDNPNHWLASYVDQSNLFYMRGYQGVADVMESICRKTGFPIPTLAMPAGVLAFYRPYATRQMRRVRWNRALQRTEVRGMQVVPKRHVPLYDGWGELLRSWYPFVRRHAVSGSTLVESQFDSPLCARGKKLTYSDRHASKLKLAWSPYHVSW